MIFLFETSTQIEHIDQSCLSTVSKYFHVFVITESAASMSRLRCKYIKQINTFNASKNAQ